MIFILIFGAIIPNRISLSISGDSHLDETLNWGSLELLLRRQYEFHNKIDIVQFFISCLL